MIADRSLAGALGAAGPGWPPRPCRRSARRGPAGRAVEPGGPSCPAATRAHARSAPSRISRQDSAGCRLLALNRVFDCLVTTVYGVPREWRGLLLGDGVPGDERDRHAEVVGDEGVDAALPHPLAVDPARAAKTSGL